MNRRERIRQFWEEKIPDVPVLFLHDVAKATHPIVTLRTLQRRAADWTLPTIGGPERNSRYYKVLRTDLMEFLCALDSITGEDRSAGRRKRPVRRRKKAVTTPRAGKAARHADQKTLFE